MRKPQICPAAGEPGRSVPGAAGGEVCPPDPHRPRQYSQVALQTRASCISWSMFLNSIQLKNFP